MKENYQKKKEEFANLPSYEELDINFDLESISKDDNIIREILKKIADRLEFYGQILESLVQPDSTFSSMKEASALSPKERKIVLDRYAQIMGLLRDHALLALGYSEGKATILISNQHKAWQEMKPDLKELIAKLKEVWENQGATEKQEGYFG